MRLSFSFWASQGDRARKRGHTFSICTLISSLSGHATWWNISQFIHASWDNREQLWRQDGWRKQSSVTQLGRRTCTWLRVWALNYEAAWLLLSEARKHIHTARYPSLPDRFSFARLLKISTCGGSFTSRDIWMLYKKPEPGDKTCEMCQICWWWWTVQQGMHWE